MDDAFPLDTQQIHGYYKQRLAQWPRTKRRVNTPKSHTLTQTRSQERIRDGQKTEILVEGEILRVEEYHRLVCQRRETRVDVRDDFGYPSLGFVLFGCLEGNLDEDDLGTCMVI